jgi:hypothetical protein
MGWEELDLADVYFGTHGLVFDYGSPLTVTGLVVEVVPVKDTLTLTAFGANGLDNPLPQDRLSAGLRVDVAATRGVDIGVVGMADAIGDGDEQTTWAGGDVTLDLGSLRIGAEGVFGRQKSIVKLVDEADPEGKKVQGPASWFGAALTALFHGGGLGGALRAEWFKDKFTVRRQTPLNDPSASEVAITGAFLVGLGGKRMAGSHLVVEVRHDRSLIDGAVHATAATVLLVHRSGGGGGADGPEEAGEDEAPATYDGEPPKDVEPPPDPRDAWGDEEE